MNKLYNLIPECNTAKWYTWSPSELQSPEFSQESVDTGCMLKITSSGIHSYGKWCCDIDYINGGDTYNFSVEYTVESVPCEAVSVSAILSWMKNAEECSTRDYVSNINTLENGWKVLSRQIDAPAEAVSLKVELVLKWPGDKGCVLWKNPSLERSNDLVKRNVKIATTYINPYIHNEISLEQRLDKICNVVDEAGIAGADIICLSETINDRALPLTMKEKSLPLHCEFTSAMREKAKHYNCYIIYSFHEDDAGYMYNTAILIDRNGNITGKYRKTHLALCEGESGIIPGNEYPVFDTDFGKIGILICWDHYFPEPSRILALKGAEILFVSTAGDAPVQSLARAIDNGVFMVISGVNRVQDSSMMPSRIINPRGEVIGEVEDEDIGICIREIDLNKRTYLYWLSVGSCYGEPYSVYLKDRMPNTYEILSEYLYKFSKE